MSILTLQWGGDSGRENILSKVRTHRNIRVMFVESICDNKELLEANYRRYRVWFTNVSVDSKHADIDCA